VAGGTGQPGRTVTSKVLAILAAFDSDHTSLTLSDISRRAGLPLATTHRLVHELVEWRALSRDPAGGFRVGLRLWELGQLAPVRLQDAAHPWLQELFATTRENVHLAVRDGMEVLYVDKIYGRRAVPIVSRVGGRLPMHATGVGKALLAHQPDWFIRSYLGRPLERPTARTITDPTLLARELQQVRTRGVAVTDEEMTLGTCSLAVPVRDVDGEVVAAVGIVVSSRRRQELTRLVAPLREGAMRIEQALREDGARSAVG
jgi:DNA-binding IclR family transcriptional regulator